MLALAQLRAPACESDTVALLPTPGLSVTDPKSRSWILEMTSDLTFVALTLAITVAAHAGAPTAARPINAARIRAGDVCAKPTTELGTTEMVEFRSTMLGTLTMIGGATGKGP